MKSQYCEKHHIGYMSNSSCPFCDDGTPPFRQPHIDLDDDGDLLSDMIIDGSDSYGSIE